MKNILSFSSSSKKVLAMAAIGLTLFLIADTSMADTVVDLTQKGIDSTKAVAKFLTAAFFLGAVFAGGMFGWKIYQHGKDAREHKLSTAFIYLLGAACLIGAGFFVTTMSNTMGANGQSLKADGGYGSFGN